RACQPVHPLSVLIPCPEFPPLLLWLEPRLLVTRTVSRPALTPLVPVGLRDRSRCGREGSVLLRFLHRRILRACRDSFHCVGRLSLRTPSNEGRLQVLLGVSSTLYSKRHLRGIPRS